MMKTITLMIQVLMFVATKCESIALWLEQNQDKIVYEVNDVINLVKTTVTTVYNSGYKTKVFYNETLAPKVEYSLVLVGVKTPKIG